jgi:hypothetical protein
MIKRSKKSNIRIIPWIPGPGREGAAILKGVRGIRNMALAASTPPVVKTMMDRTVLNRNT